MIWIEWLDEEVKNAKTPEKRKEVLKLYEKALEDFDCNFFYLFYNFFVLKRL